ncbi:MAG: hypothetical protein U9R38_04545 [Candidatus Margulisiibacteriota bacterium]|nr:hypothetical protein [Candidatus Margulisiibacteriota bacterium]
MGEETKNVDDLLKQIGEFEKTLDGLKQNVGSLKTKLLESKEKFGIDINKWPKDAQ